jgi:hypothetical protein
MGERRRRQYWRVPEMSTAMSWYPYRGRCIGRVLHFVEHYCGLHLAEHVIVSPDAVMRGEKLLATYTWSDRFREWDVPEFKFAPSASEHEANQWRQREAAIIDGCALEAPATDKRQAVELSVLDVLRHKSSMRIGLWAHLHDTQQRLFICDHKLFAEVAGRIYQLDADSGEWMIWYVPERHAEMERAMGDGEDGGGADVTFTDEELYVLWAAMWAMADDVHSPQDCMTNEQWDLAAELRVRLDARINELHAAKTGTA